MTQEATEARRLLAALGEQPMELDEPEVRAARRERVVRHLVEVNRAAPSHLSRRRAIGAALLAAAAAAAVALGLGTVDGPASVVTVADVEPADTLAVTVTAGVARHGGAGAETELPAGMAVRWREAGVLETLADGGARVDGANGLAIEVGAATRVALPGRQARGELRQVELLRGSVRCSVTPGTAEKKLAVVTPDARVVVKGTVFSVEVAPESVGPTRTCVRVERGVVAVTHDGVTSDVGAGQAWGCSPPATAAGAVTPSDASPQRADGAPPASSVAAVSAASGRVAAPPRGDGSTLGVEGKLLADALAAERRGDLDGAEAKLVQLIDKYPTSPLRPDAAEALGRVRAKRSPR